MKELLDASLMVVNLPFTILLALIVFYWITVILGALDMDFLNFEMDADADADIDVDLDADVEAGVDTDADLATEVDADADAHGHGGGAFYSILAFINMGKVPFMIVMSFLILSLWVGSVLLNHYINRTFSLLIAAAIFFPNLIVAMLITKVLTTPLTKLFKALDAEQDQFKTLVGMYGVMTITADHENLGQIEIEHAGASLRLNAKTDEGKKLYKGQRAIIVEEHKDNHFYIVEEFNE